MEVFIPSPYPLHSLKGLISTFINHKSKNAFFKI